MEGKSPTYGRRRVRTRHGLTRDVRRRLTDLGRQVPPPTDDQIRNALGHRARRLLRQLAVVLVVVVVVGAAVGGTVQWLRRLPPPTLRATAIRIPGKPLTLPWPSIGEAALGVPGVASLEQDRDRRPVPTGVLSGVLVAYVILRDHPLSTGGDTGPGIVVATPTVEAFKAGRATGQPEVPVRLGESLSELDALEGLVIDSAGDMGTLLADWDANTTFAFAQKMDKCAVSLGLRRTSASWAIGADDTVVSTPNDLIRLAEAAMRIPVFSQMVSLGELNLPNIGAQYNPNFALGKNGVIGIDVGSDSKASGSYLFAAHVRMSGQAVFLYGVVLDQSGPIGPDAAAVNAGQALMNAALSDLRAVKILKGRVVGRLSTPWGTSTLVELSQSLTVIAWPGTTLPITSERAGLTVPLETGSLVGWLQLHVGSRLVKVALRNATALQGPTGLWRLTR